MKKLAAPVAALSAALLVAQGQQNIWQMGVKFSGYTGPKAVETLTDFPALVTFTDDMAGGDFFNTHSFASPHGWDLRFFSADNTPLDYEIDTFDPPNIVQVWVRLPSLTPDGLTSIRAEWGDPLNALEPEPYTVNGAVWVNHLLVHHYNNTNTTEIADAAGSAWVAGILAPEPNIANQYTNGVIGRAVNLTRSYGTPNHAGHDNGLLVRTAQPGGLGIPVGNNWTISAWFKDIKEPGSSNSGFWRTLTRGTAANHHVIIHQNSDALGLHQGGFCQAGIPAPNPPVDTLGTASLSPSPVWRHITAVGRCSNAVPNPPVGTTELYVDGVFVGTINRVVINDIKGIGGFQGTHTESPYPNPNQQFADYLDEFRVAGVARSAAWIWADHQTQSSAPGFTSFTAPVPADDLFLVRPATSVFAESAVFNGRMRVAAAADVTVFWATNGVLAGQAELGSQNSGPVTCVMEPLLPLTEYACWFRATNGVFTAHSPTNTFYTRPETLLYWGQFTNDFQTGISSNRVYTHALDVGNNSYHPLVEGVRFTSVNTAGGSINGYGWEGVQATNAEGNTGYIKSDPNSGIYQALRSLRYQNQTGTLRLTGLTPGQEYEARIFLRAWDNNTRNARLTYMPDSAAGALLSDTTGPGWFNADGNLPYDRYVAYRYAVGANGELSVYYESELSGSTLHIYAISNEKIVPISTSVLGCADVTANLRAHLFLTNTVSDLELHWGDVDAKDESEVSWQGSAPATASPAGTPFHDATAFGLSPDSTYYYRFSVMTPKGRAWSDTGTFTTYPTQPIINTRPATDVAWTNATAWCDVLWPGVSGITDLAVWYGVSNGWDNEGQWQAAATNANILSAGAQSNVLTGLLPNTTYWYRWRADSVWASGSASFTTLPAIVPLAPSNVACTNATVDCRVDYAGPAAAAQIVLWYGTVNGGTNPSAWQASASATPGIGNHAQFLGGLLPATVYHYRWQIDGVWYGGGTFTTSPSIELLAPTGVDGSAATVNCRVWYAGPSGVADLVLYYGTADHGKDAKLWTEFTPATIPGATPGEHAATLSGLSSTTLYYYRWFTAGAWSEAGVFATIPGMPNVGSQQVWVWSGGFSTSWANRLNWKHAATGDPPDDISELFYHTVRLVSGSSFEPLEQDIADLALCDLQIGAFNGPVAIHGNPVVLHNLYNDQGGSGHEIAFHTGFYCAADAAKWTFQRTTRFYGVMREFKGSKIFKANMGGQVHFHGPVTWTGGFQPGETGAGTLQFYGDHTTGAAPLAFTPDYFAYFPWGSVVFNAPPAPLAPYYELDSKKGVTPRLYFNIPSGSTLALDAPISENTNANNAGLANGSENRIAKSGGGTLELNGAVNYSKDGLVNNDGGLIILNGSLAPGGVMTGNGSLDLNGVDYPGRNIAFTGNTGGHNYDGLIRNQNPLAESRVTGNVTGLNGGDNSFHDNRQFGGIGDIRLEGNVTAGGNVFTKVGSGKLTLAGETTFLGNFYMFGGILALDYAANPGRKLGGSASILQLHGELLMLGNPDADTTETINLLANTSGWYDLNSIRVSPRGANGRAATLKCASYNFSAHWNGVNATVDFAPGAGGAILVATAANQAPTGILSPRFTFNGESYARVAESAAPGHPGYFAVEPLPDFEYTTNAFASATANNGVDIDGEILLPNSPQYAGFLRFASPRASSLTLQNHLYLLGNSTYQYANGALLVTPSVGTNAVVINSTGGSQLYQRGEYGSYFYIHQYNTAAPLVINAQISDYWYGSNTRLVKTGPGELILTHPNSGFGPLAVLEGVLSFNSVINGNLDAVATSVSALGSGRGGNGVILLSSATLRYNGTDPAGHSTDRQIRLRGKGVLDASGEGPIRYTRPDFVVRASDRHNNNFLTLDGTGEGEIWGRLELYGGRVFKKGTGLWTFPASSTNSWIWGMDVWDGELRLDGRMGRDVTVHAGAVLSGTGLIDRHLILEAGATLDLDPDKGPLAVGKNLSLAPGATLQLPRRIPSEWKPVLVVGGEIKGEIPDKQDHAYFKVENGTVYTRFRPRGTLMILR